MYYDSKNRIKKFLKLLQKRCCIFVQHNRMQIHSTIQLKVWRCALGYFQHFPISNMVLMIRSSSNNKTLCVCSAVFQVYFQEMHFPLVVRFISREHFHFSILEWTFQISRPWNDVMSADVFLMRHNWVSRITL